MVSPFTRKNQIDRCERRLHRLRERRTRRIINLHVQVYPTRVITRAPSPDVYSPITDLPPYIDYSHPQFPETSNVEPDTFTIDPNHYFTPDPEYYIPDQNPQDPTLIAYDPFIQSNNEQDPNIFDEETIDLTFDGIRDVIPEEARDTLESFITYLNQTTDPERELDNIVNQLQASQESSQINN